MINFKHCSDIQTFNTKKISANINDTEYTVGIGGEVIQGTPDVLWTSIVFIDSPRQIWTHGVLYSCATDIILEDDDKVEIEGKKTVTAIDSITGEQVYIGSHAKTTYMSDGSNVEDYLQSQVKKLLANTELKFYCVEPVSVRINDTTTDYDANSHVDIFLNIDDDFEIIPTSDNSILSLSAYPGALGTYFSWLEGVHSFDGILFDMNNADMYTKWNQGNQGMYHVQLAQYTNCVFWSDNPYISELSLRTNYTLYYSAQLPLCYSTIPENTYKAFYMAYGVNSDPNWSNPAYRDSFAAATYATQTFSYYGARTIGVFNMEGSIFNITLPKDCRGLMFYATTIENAGIFDAINVTNFGAKSGSWRDAFGYCYNLKNLYIKNLKVSIDLSWSPINVDSIEYIVSNAVNTNAITISVSPYTWYRLSEDLIASASEKKITIALLSGHYMDDKRWSLKQDAIVDLDDIRSGASLGATALQSYTEQYQGTVEAVDITEEVDGVSNDFVTTEQLDARGYATEDFVVSKIAETSISGGVSLDGYATQTWVAQQGYVKSSDISNVATSGSYNDLSNKPYIPSIEGLASESYVNQQISKIQHPTYDDSELWDAMENKADRTELFSGKYDDLTNKPTIPSVEGLASETFVKAEIAKAQLEIEGEITVDLGGYATKDDLKLKADKTEIPSIEGLASESYVQQELAKIQPDTDTGVSGDDNVSDEEKEYVNDMIYSVLNGLKFIRITPERYESLTTVDPNTIYILVTANELNNSTGEPGVTDTYNLVWVEGSNLSDTGAVVTNDSQAAYRLSDYVKVNPEYNYKVYTSSSSQFQVFYYDKNKNYIGKSTIRNDKTELALYGYEGFCEFPEEVKYIRIRTNNKTSTVEVSELGKRDDTSVPFQFRNGYTVASNGSVSAATGYMASGDIKLEPDYNYDITFNGNKTRVVFFNTDGNKTGSCLPTDTTYYEGETTLTRADIPEAAVSFRLRFATGGEVNMNNINEHLSVTKTPKASKYIMSVTGWIPSQGLDENGTEIDDIDSMRSGYMSITSGYDYMYTLRRGVPFGFQIYYYDSSKTFISASDIQDDPCGNKRFDIPSGASYFRIKVSQQNTLTINNINDNVEIKKMPTVDGMLYSFGVLSDVHVDAGSDGNFYDQNYATNDYRKAVKFMEDEGAEFVAYGGDMASGDPGVSEQDYRKVLEILQNAYIPHYMISGNHDYGYFFKALIESRKYYVVEKNQDMFIFVNAQSRGNTGGIDREIVDGVRSLIENNPNKRIFLFFHYFIRNHGSGDGATDVTYYTGDTLGDAYDQYPISKEWADLIIGSPNVIFCHGHSHFRFQCVNVYEYNNYYHADGECHSVHIPSCAVPRSMSADSTTVTNWPAGSEGYMVRVFADRVEFHAVQLSAYRYLTTYNFSINLPQGN